MVGAALQAVRGLLGEASLPLIASAAIIGCFGVEARGASAPVDRWSELAAAHEPENCARCRPHPRAAASVADVVRRMRHDASAPAATSVVSVNIAADVRHVASVATDDRDRQILHIADELAQHDVRAGARFAAALPPGRGQNGAMLVVVSIWVRNDRQSALNWAQALPDERTRGAALDEVSRRLVAADAPAAAVLVSALPAGPGREDALCGIARHWARRDRTAALTWVGGLTESPTKTRILNSPEFAAKTE